MTPQRLLEGYHWAVENYYRTLPIFKRVFLTPWFYHTKRLSWFMNWHLREMMCPSFRSDTGSDHYTEKVFYDFKPS
jgi:hypothetical protein